MKLARSSYTRACTRAVLTAAVLMTPALGDAHETGAPHVHFQKPNRGAAPAPSSSTLQFRSSTAAKADDGAATGADVQQATLQQVAKPIASAARSAQVPTVRQAPAQSAARPAFTSQSSGETADYRTASVARSPRVLPLEHNEPLFSAPARRSGLIQTGYYDGCVDCTEPACGISEPACGCAEPTCEICEPGCGVEEPACGIVEPGCGLIEPGCELLDPSCGCDGDECGSCVGRPGPDYWCFPVCLPRFKDFSFWGGVHGFKGPRDSPAFRGSALGGGDGNFGFQEGLNLGGRAPLVGLIFPQLSYQAGYQAVQSQLSGNSDGSGADRSQQFVTAGLFRRVRAGLQLGAVWDMMRDDLFVEEDFHQVRYEISVKGHRGLEFGFWGATHTNNAIVLTRDLQAVDQYNFFLRYHFRDAGEIRFWGGFTNDDEGIFGGDIYAPLSNRWSLQTGFNYLIPEAGPGAVAAREESWNVGMNLVWHWGLTAKKSRTNPHRPLFSTADNGSMFIDERP